MDGRRSQPVASPDLVFEAESLIRSLTGVVSARVRGSSAGIDAVHVEATDGDTARHVAGHVRSALLAALATPVVPERIHVSVADPPPSGQEDDDPPHRLRILRGGDPDDDMDAAVVPDFGQAPTRMAARAGPIGSAATAPDLRARDLASIPRLIAVDIDRPSDGRVLCRVSVAFGNRVHRAEAVALDLPGAAAQAAAQAAVRALLDAGIGRLELNGVREVEIAGRDYVVVALRRDGIYPRTRAGSAPVVGSAERSAAEAAVVAAEQMI